MTTTTTLRPNLAYLSSRSHTLPLIIIFPSFPYTTLFRSYFALGGLTVVSRRNGRAFFRNGATELGVSCEDICPRCSRFVLDTVDSVSRPAEGDPMTSSLAPYIALPGTMAEAMKHWHDVFGGELHVL